MDSKLLTGTVSIYKSDRPNKVWREGMYMNGQLEGKWLEYHANGKLSRSQKFNFGLPDATSRYWYKNGKKRALYNLKEGKQHGDQWEWALGGWLADYKKYYFGKLLIHKIWRSKDQIYSAYTIRDRRFLGKGGEKLCRKVTPGEGKKNALVE